MGKRGPQSTPLGELVFWEGLWYWVFRHLRGILPAQDKIARDAAVRTLLSAELRELENVVAEDIVEEDWLSRSRARIQSQLRPNVPLSEPGIWRALVTAKTAADVRRACRESQRWLNPDWQGRPYVQDLNDHAEQFIRAKQDVYYPRRDSGDVKRVVFFARAMAGISLGMSPVTAVDRLRKLKHGEQCPCVNCDLKRWDRIEGQIYKNLFEPEKKGLQKRRRLK